MNNHLFKETTISVMGPILLCLSVDVSLSGLIKKTYSGGDDYEIE